MLFYVKTQDFLEFGLVRCVIKKLAQSVGADAHISLQSINFIR